MVGTSQMGYLFLLSFDTLNLYKLATIYSGFKILCHDWNPVFFCELSISVYQIKSEYQFLFIKGSFMVVREQNLVRELFANFSSF